MNCARAKEMLAALVVDRDESLKRHLQGCADCRREAAEIERTLRALGPLAMSEGAALSGDDLFVASVRRGYEEAVARRGRKRWRLPAVTLGLAASAALLALFGPRPIFPRAPHLSPSVESRTDDDFSEEDACELIGDLDHDEVLRVDAQYRKGA